MDYLLFCDWLINKKAMSQRAAKDVISRCKRVEKMTGTENIYSTSIDELALIESYNNSSMFIKSQLKRAITLAMEFKEDK